VPLAERLQGRLGSVSDNPASRLRFGGEAKDLAAGLAALTGNRLLYRDGIPVALFAGGGVDFLVTLDAGTKWQACKILLRGPSIFPSANLRRGGDAAADAA
jgi:hypothetical protein